MDYRLLEIKVCPICNGKLYYNKIRQEIICKFDKLAFPVLNGIPILLEGKARTLSVEEILL